MSHPSPRREAMWNAGNSADNPFIVGRIVAEKPVGAQARTWEDFASRGVNRPACSRRMMTLLVGTNRPGSNSRKVANQIEGIYRDLRVPLEVVDLAGLPLEVFLASAYATKPPGFTPFSEAILRASGLHVVTPEYNGSVPGVLKYFIDMLKFPESFESRPVCFTGVAAGMWGALRPVEQLQAIFGYRNAHLFPERVFIPRIHEQLDERGQVRDPELVGRLRAQAEGFVGFVERLKGVTLRG